MTDLAPPLPAEAYARLKLRPRIEQKAAWVEAAHRSGLTLSDFVTRALNEKARAVLAAKKDRAA